MSSSSQRERAEAAFGHIQHAASEVIAAAHDALDMLDDAVTTAGLAEMLDTVGQLSQSLLKLARSRLARAAPPPPSPSADGPRPAPAPRPHSTVQRISVR